MLSPIGRAVGNSRVPRIFVAGDGSGRHVKIAITGANSGVGNILLRYLASCSDVQVVACVRSAHAAAALPASARISTQVVDYGDREALVSTLSETSCVVHLAGILFESATSTYETANVAATQAVVDACKNAGVARVVLVSVLGADSTSTNSYLSSKGRAERIVFESGLSAA